MKIVGLVLKKKYQILEKIHENDRFHSFRGVNLENNDKVFIKVVKKEIILQKDKNKIRFFTEEVKALARMKHENVVKVFDVDFKNGILYVVSEWVDGRALSSFISSREKFDFWQVIQIIRQLADVLKFAYSNGIKYRTVKHSNIFISNSMKVKILSFNVPRSLLSPVPIPIKENKGQDPDIFFLGVVLYELLTMKFPLSQKEIYITDFDMIDEDLLNKRWNLTFDDVDDPSLKEEIEKIIYHSTTRKILDRYKSIEEMLTELKNFSNKKENEMDKNNNKTADNVLKEFGDTSLLLDRRLKKEENNQKSFNNKKNINTFNKSKSVIPENIDEESNLWLKIGVIFSVIIALGYFVYILLF